MKCKCGNIKEGSIFRSNILGVWRLDCPVCNLPQETMITSEIYNSKEWPVITQSSNEEL
jgi:hypothetical protein